MAITFNGTTQAIDLGTDINILRNVGACSLMIWARPSVIPTTNALISIAIGPPPGLSGASRATLEIGGSASLQGGFRASDGETIKNIAIAGQFVAGQWGHFAVTCDYGTGILTAYKNGAQVGTTTVVFVQGTTSDTNSKNGAIGAGDNVVDNFFSGALEDARVYNRLLSAAEIQTIASAMGADGIVSGLQLRIGLNEAGEGVVATACPDISNDVRRVGTPVASPTYLGGIIRGTRSKITHPIGIRR